MSTTSVSFTITDTDGTAWANGTWLAQFVGAQGSNVNGVSFTQKFTGSLDGSGHGSVTLTDNLTVTPANSLWLFTFVSNTSAKGGQYAAVITGASMNISSAASAAMPAPRLGGQVLPHAYGDVELLTPPAPGAIYFDVATGSIRQWNGSAWGPITGTVSSVVLPGSVSGAITLSGGTVAGTNTATFPPNTGVVAELNLSQDWTAVQNFDVGLTASGSITAEAGVQILSQQFLLYGTVNGNVTLECPSTGGTGFIATVPYNTGTIAELNLAQEWVAAQTFDSGDFKLKSSGGGSTTVQPAASASSFTATLPAHTGTVAEIDLAQTWTATQTFGSALVQNLEGVRYADQYAGADWAAKINAADADLGGTAGTIIVPASLAGSASTTVALSSGRKLVFDPGIFISSASPAFNFAAGLQNITLLGAGPQLSVLKTSSGTADLLQFNGTIGSQINNVLIEGLSFDSTVTRTAGAFIALTYVQFPVIRSIDLFDCFYGINFATGTGSVKVSEVNCVAVANSGAMFIIQTGSGSGLFFNNISGNSNSETSTASGIAWLSGSDVRVSQADLVQFGTALNVIPGGGVTVSEGWFTDCTFDSSFGDNVHLGATAGNVQALNFNGCWASSCNNSGTGVFIGSNVDSVTWSGGMVFANAGNGIAITASSNVRIIGAAISGNSRASSGTHNGIEVTANKNNFIIDGCRVGPIAGNGNTQNFGILVNTGTSDDYIITNNDCHGNISSGVSDGGSGTHKTVTGNLT